MVRDKHVFTHHEDIFTPLLDLTRSFNCNFSSFMCQHWLMWYFFCISGFRPANSKFSPVKNKIYLSSCLVTESVTQSFMSSLVFHMIPLYFKWNCLTFVSVCSFRLFTFISPRSTQHDVNSTVNNLNTASVHWFDFLFMDEKTDSSWDLKTISSCILHVNVVKSSKISSYWGFIASIFTSVLSFRPDITDVITTS